jgi:DNA-binding CsgD family transcriptional regulator
VTQARHEVHPPFAAYQTAAGRRPMPRRAESSNGRGAALLGGTGPMVSTFSRLTAVPRGEDLTPEPDAAEPGGTVCSADGANGASAEVSEVTAEELVILTLMANGLTLDSVAIRVSMSPRTLSRRLRCVCDRLGVAHPIQAIVWAARQGLI